MLKAKDALILSQTKNRILKIIYECCDIIQNAALCSERKTYFGLLKEDFEYKVFLIHKLKSLGYKVKETEDKYLEISW